MALGRSKDNGPTHTLEVLSTTEWPPSAISFILLEDTVPARAATPTVRCPLSTPGVAHGELILQTRATCGCSIPLRPSTILCACSLLACLLLVSPLRVCALSGQLDVVTGCVFGTPFHDAPRPLTDCVFSRKWGFGTCAPSWSYASQNVETVSERAATALPHPSPCFQAGNVLGGVAGSQRCVRLCC